MLNLLNFDALNPNNIVRNALSRRGIQDIGQNADWIDSAWNIGTHDGQPLFLVEDDDYGFYTCIRFYCGINGDGVYTDIDGRPMPAKYAADADGHNDHIVLIDEHGSVETMTEAVELVKSFF